MDVDFVYKIHGWVVGDHLTILATSDAGDTWTSISEPETGSILGVDFVNAHHGWAVGTFNHVLHTIDGGRTWTEQDVPDVHWLIDVKFLNPSHGWVPVSGDRCFEPLMAASGGSPWICCGMHLTEWLFSSTH